MREHSSARKEVSGISSGWALPEASVVLHALEQRGPELTQFDQVVYTATVTVTFDVMTADKK